MGEIERRSRRRRIKEILKIAATAIIAWTLMGAVLIIPMLKKTFCEYGKYKAQLEQTKTEYKKVNEELKKNKNILEKKETLDDEISEIKNEVFKSAVKLEKDINSGKSKKRICYITIDDGPYYRGNRLLKIFRKYDVKATFFLCTANGNHLPDYGQISAASMYPKYLQYGHTIGNHTYSHNYSSGGIYESSKAFMAQVKKQDAFIKDATNGYESRIVRFPGGSSTAGSNYKSIAKALHEEGYGWADWTVDTGDSGANQNSSKEILRTIAKASRKQKIMVFLCHEWSKSTEEAMPQIIKYLKSKNYIFLPLFYDSSVVQK